jgi:hypothetical protein
VDEPDRPEPGSPADPGAEDGVESYAPDVEDDPDRPSPETPSDPEGEEGVESYHPDVEDPEGGSAG